MKKRRHNSEGGYALLFIFAMAAIVAVMLYKEVPRVAFEAQRDREQLLIDRGQEYQRAVALYVHKFNRFPGSMDDLNNTNNQRFLRRQFVDPMTGKADWRILHAGPGGVITDSVNNKGAQGGSGGISTPTNMLVMTMQGVTQPGGSSDAGINLATRQRPSDQGAGLGPGGTTINDPYGGQNSAAASNPSGNGTGIPGYSGPVMVLADGRIVPATSTGVPAPGAVGASGATGPIVPGFGIPGQPGMPPGGMPGVPNLPNGVGIQTNNNVPNPSQVNAPPGSAAGLINQILTSPRPGGINGIGGMQGSAAPVSAAPGGAFGSTPGMPTSTPGAPAAPGGAFGSTPGVPTSTPGVPAAPAGQQVIGAGLAGVASKREQEGIKTYNDHTKYNEWEFVYDVSKDASRVAQGAPPGAAGASGGQGNQNQNNAQSPFGQSSAFGGSSSPLPGMTTGASATTTPH